MSPPSGGYFRKPTPPLRPSSARHQPQPRGRTGARPGLALSIVLHATVLLALVRLGDLAPAPLRFEVFAAEAVHTAPEPAIGPVSPETPLPGSIVAPPPAPRPQSTRSPVASARPRASARSRAVAAKPAITPRPSVASAVAPPELPRVAVTPSSPSEGLSRQRHPEPGAAVAVSPPITPATTVAPPSVAAPPEAFEEPFPAQRAPDFPALEAPAAPAVPTHAALPPPGAPTDAPVPAAAEPVSLPPRPDGVSPALASAAPLQPVPALPLTMAPSPNALDLSRPDPPSPPAPIPTFTPLARSGDPEPPVATTPAPQPQVAAPPPPERIPAAEPAVSSTPAMPVEAEPLPPTAARAVSARPADTPATGASPLGLGFGRLRIRLDGPSIRTTDRETAVISGTLVGGEPERVVVQLDQQTSVPTLAGRAFATAVKLSPGVNRVRVVATDAHGAEVEEILTVEYRPPATVGVTITSPRDGHVLAPGDLPLLAVQGEVTDRALGTVWIVANDRRVMVPVTAGQFRHVLPVLEPVVRVRAETEREGRSETVTVDASAALPAIGVLLTDWPHGVAGAATMTVTWRPNPSRLDGGAKPLTLGGIARDGEAGADFFYLRNARPGVYTLRLIYRAGATLVVRPVLSVAGASRPLPPVTLDGSGRAVLARVLLPQGVLWEQDDWFTGQSKSGDTVTKFRFPEGLSWIERIGELGR